MLPPKTGNRIKIMIKKINDNTDKLDNRQK